MKIVLKKRRPESRLGQIRDITLDGAQGTARGTSLVAGHAERKLQNINIGNLRLRMLAEDKPDKRATDALVFENVDNLTLRGIEVDLDLEQPEPKWRSGLVLRDVSGLLLREVKAPPARPDDSWPGIVKENVSERVWY
jgi:hypothetical protein